MALSLDLLNLICTVDQNDMLDVTGAAVSEIRELDANDFRKEWGALMDDEPNVSSPWPFEWTQPVTLGGVTYAGLLRIINGWTVIFTPAAYSVNIVGANTNMSDVIIKNTVGINTGNSAGLIETATTGLTPDESLRLETILKLFRNRRETDPVTGQQRVYDDDDTTVLVEGDLYEDIAGTTPYGPSSQKIDRADRMS